MDVHRVLEFANQQGYDGIQYLGRWQDWETYEPIFDGTGDVSPTFIGPPLVILVRGDVIRMSTADEAFHEMLETPESVLGFPDD